MTYDDNTKELCVFDTECVKNMNKSVSLLPTTYEVVEFHFPCKSATNVTIELTWQRELDNGLYPEIPKDWSQMWTIRSGGLVYGLNGLEWEPRPSERDWAFIQRTRFKTVDAAYKLLAKYYGLPPLLTCALP